MKTPARARFLRLVLLPSLALPFILAAPPARAAEPVPVLLGVDMAGSYHLRDPFFPEFQNGYWLHESFFQALDDLGAGYVGVHLFPVVDQGAGNEAAMLQMILDIDAAMTAHGLSYSLNNEDANFVISREITPGVNEFTLSGFHRWDLRMTWLDQLLPPARPGAPAFLGVIYDETELMQLTRNQYANNIVPPFIPPSSYDVPCLADTDGMDLLSAYGALVLACQSLRFGHYQNRVPLASEHVLSDLLHIYARAGWTLSPKLMKESLSSVTMSIALGAALQYQDSGTELWITPDLHYPGFYPGHSPAALSSALLMAYWLGAGTIYVENLDFHHSGPRHPESSPEGSLLHWFDDETYEITAHGAAVQDFFRAYVPAHPRFGDWRNYRPRVAIVRLPDGSVGQPAAYTRRWLLGNPDLPMDEISEEWLQVWPILTHGRARANSIYSGHPEIYADGPGDFFVPIDSVAVFDHEVAGPVLDSVECFVVCGHALSAASFSAIAARVAAGATAVIARRLYDAHASGALPGNWAILDSFTDPALASALAPFLGPPDLARFRFADRTVEFTPGSVPDSISARIEIAGQSDLASAWLGLAPIPPDADRNADGAFDSADILAPN